MSSRRRKIELQCIRTKNWFLQEVGEGDWCGAMDRVADANIENPPMSGRWQRCPWIDKYIETIRRTNRKCIVSTR